MASLLAIGTDLRHDLPDTPNVGRGRATTLVVGHLAIQVFASHALPEHSARAEGDLAALSNTQPKPGDWESFLIRTWPVGSRPVSWPPLKTFTNGGVDSIAYLMGRWKTGDAAVGQLTEDS